MKRLFLILILGILCYSCGTQNKIVNDNSNSKMILLIDDTFTRIQLDSLCVADTISSNLDTWLCATFVDYETNTPIKEYSYIKTLNEDEILYKVIENETNYKITKRLTDN